MTRLSIPLVLLVVAFAAVVSAGPEVWRVATQSEFLKGDLEQVSVDEHGRLTLGPAIAPVFDATAPIVWTAVADASGTTYLGTGNDGKVVRVDASGKGGVFYDSAELGVHALALAPGGGLYVGTSPDGRVYRVDRSGTATPFFDPDEKYIWAIATDATGDVYVATGDPKGRVYRVTPLGAATPLYTSGASHVVSMAFDGARRLVVGTESPGRVFRLDAEGRPFLLLDTDLQEVRALRADARGRILVVAQARRSGSGDAGPSEPPAAAAEPPRAPVPTVTVSITSMSVVDPQPAAGVSGGTRPDGGAVTGAIFRIDADGTPERLWRRGARRHRTPRQDLPARRRSGAGHAPWPCAGSSSRTVRRGRNPHARGDVERWRAREARHQPRRARHLHLRGEGRQERRAVGLVVLALDDASWHARRSLHAIR
jgi:hypothetical protein